MYLFSYTSNKCLFNFSELFQKLFRQDLLVASLFRNFLLAERIMRSCDCTPVSSPPLPLTYQHPMWNAWDLALDLSLGQLSGIISNNDSFRHLPFFEEQLTAFQVWLELGKCLCILLLLIFKRWLNCDLFLICNEVG